MTPPLTKANVERFFRAARDRVPTDVLVREFDARKPSKVLRLQNTLDRLENEGKIVKFPNNVYQWAEYAHETALKINEKAK